MSPSKTSQKEENFTSLTLLVEKTNPGSFLLDAAYEGKETCASKYHSENVVLFLPWVLPP